MQQGSFLNNPYSDWKQFPIFNVPKGMIKQNDKLLTKNIVSYLLSANRDMLIHNSEGI